MNLRKIKNRMINDITTSGVYAIGHDIYCPGRSEELVLMMRACIYPYEYFVNAILNIGSAIFKL